MVALHYFINNKSIEVKRGYKMAYCPLTDKHGEMLLLSQIEYNDFSQLVSIDEGYEVEYKSMWDDSVKYKHLSRTISSFANTEGGWLFIGVNDDGSLNPIKKERTDFGQQISQIVKSRISPLPFFESRFVRNPANENTGILIISVRESVEPPCICEGTVYLRIGNSKEPQKASSSNEINTLINKRHQSEKKLSDFCQNEIFPNLNDPYCNIYLYNRYPGRRIGYSPSDINRIKKFALKHHYQATMISNESFLLYNSSQIAINAYCPVLEIKQDCSIKAYAPLSCVPKQIAQQISQKVHSLNPNINIDGFISVDGYLSSCGLKTLFRDALSLIGQEGFNTNNYIVKIELKNIKESYLYFHLPPDDNTWFNSIRNGEFRYSDKDCTMSRNLLIDPPPQKDVEDMIEIIVNILFIWGFYSSFGYLLDSIEIESKAGEYAAEKLGKPSYTNQEYYKTMFNI